LAKEGLLPKQIGWNTEMITSDLDAVILGMHAKADNPEIAKAQALGLKIYSFPEYIYQESKQKKSCSRWKSWKNNHYKYDYACAQLLTA
jgi:UDP-N-acetylmuramate: L-alanyl-gamma-D-glutamyl-meso-diaminopimelate ligase